MGVSGLWNVLQPAARSHSLSQLALTQGFEGNTGGHRGFRIGIDASIWFFHGKVFDGEAVRDSGLGKNADLRMLFYRCTKLMSLPFLPLFVFDGKARPKWKRGKRIVPKGSELAVAMKEIVQAFGFEYIDAPGEAEAELAYLNRIAVIDAVLTDDVDAFLFGATFVVRNWSAALNGSHTDLTSNLAGTHVTCYKADDLQANKETKLTRNGLILIGLLRGGDYHPAGVKGIGVRIAHGLAECGFGDQLIEAFGALKGDALATFLVQWRLDIARELRTDSRGIIGRKYVQLSATFPSDFPDLKVVDAYVNPVVTAKRGEIGWRSDPDLTMLAKLCKQHFGWRCLGTTLKSFRSVVWPGMLCRILRRSALLADAMAASQRAVDVTPTKVWAEFAQRTPFPRTNNTSPAQLSDPLALESLMLKISCVRKQASPDGLRDLGVEIRPHQLVMLAARGFLGKLDSNIDLAKEIADGYARHGGARRPHSEVAPDTALCIWMPARMVELAAPLLVRDFYDAQEPTPLAQGKGKDKVAQRQRTVINTNDRQPQESLRVPVASETTGLASAHSRDTEAGDVGDYGVIVTEDGSFGSSPGPAFGAVPVPAERMASPIRPTCTSRSETLLSSRMPASRSSAAPVNVASLLGPPSVQPSPPDVPMGMFFSDDDEVLPATPVRKRRTRAKGKASCKPATALPACSRDEKMEPERKRSGSGGGRSDALHKSPRRSRLQTSPHVRHHIAPLDLEQSEGIDFTQWSRAVQTPLLEQACKRVGTAVIVISDDEGPATGHSTKQSPEVIDLT